MSDHPEDTWFSSDARTHPLRQLLDDVAHGHFPLPDGGVDVFSQPPGPVDAVMAFTAHHVVAANVSESWVHAQLPGRHLSAPMSARFICALSERLGSSPGSLDVVLCGLGETGEPELVLREVPSLEHPRVERARRYRRNLRVYVESEDRGMLIIGEGLAGRAEAEFDVHPSHRGHGLGRALARAALRCVEAGEPLFMQIAPGNAASLRAILAGGFVPVAAEVLFVRA